MKPVVKVLMPPFDIQGDDVGGRCLPAVRPFGRIALFCSLAEILQLLSFNNITLHGMFLMRESKRLKENGSRI